MTGDRPPDGRGTVVTGAERGWAWVDHLRSGGSTPWHDFAGAASAPRAGARLLPGAIQLEVARRLNALGGRDDAAHRDLVEAVLAASAPGRGQPDLELVGIHDGSPFGPPPVDPADLPVEELVRMAVGVLADRALARPAPPVVEHRRLPVPWRRGHRLVGDPLLGGAHPRRAAGRRPPARPPLPGRGAARRRPARHARRRLDLAGPARGHPVVDLVGGPLGPPRRAAAPHRPGRGRRRAGPAAWGATASTSSSVRRRPRRCSAPPPAPARSRCPPTPASC